MNLETEIKSKLIEIGLFNYILSSWNIFKDFNSVEYASWEDTNFLLEEWIHEKYFSHLDFMIFSENLCNMLSKEKE